jgi:AbrB family looped-hinge helix DNA binding protein
MDTTVTKRGQTVVPAAIRRRHQINAGDRLAWVDDGTTIRVVPLAADPIKALRGAAKGGKLTKRLLETRARDRQRGS